MTYTSLHRSVGAPAGPVTEELIDAAVAAKVVESEDLDWKLSTGRRQGQIGGLDGGSAT